MTPSVLVTTETFTVSWIVAFGAILELVALILLLTRVSWWLSNRFTLLDSANQALRQEVGQIQTELSNDIAGRKVIAEARTDIAQMKTSIAEMRDRMDRLETQALHRPD